MTALQQSVKKYTFKKPSLSLKLPKLSGETLTSIDQKINNGTKNGTEVTSDNKRLSVLFPSKEDSDSDFEFPSFLAKSGANKLTSASLSTNKDFSPQGSSLFKKFTSISPSTNRHICPPESSKSVNFGFSSTRPKSTHSGVLATTVPETQLMDVDEHVEDFCSDRHKKSTTDDDVVPYSQDNTGVTTPEEYKPQSTPTCHVSCRDSLTWAQNTQKRLDKSASFVDIDVMQLQLQLLRHMCGLLESSNVTSWRNNLPHSEKSLLQKLLDINISLKQKKVGEPSSLKRSTSLHSPANQVGGLTEPHTPIPKSGFDNTIASFQRLRSPLVSQSDQSRTPVGFSSWTAEKVTNSKMKQFPPSETQIIEIDDTQVPEDLFRTSSPTHIEDYENCSLISNQANTSKVSTSSMFDEGGQFRGVYRDDGASTEFTGYNFPHSNQMTLHFRQVFGLKSFRRNQLQAINACMLGKDCFILMPTGGGKSLCYQLTALLSSGVTFVISPLRSLIQDQVQRLCSLGVSATHMCNDISGSSVSSVYSDLYKKEPGLKLVYVTPEKLSCSNALQSALDSLFQRKLIARFVIDEAHCISQWGHDFRPDYKRLCYLREKYPGVPIMALTATATPRVRTDILNQLRMSDPKWFLQSFNRCNLKYQVVPKKATKITSEIIELIRSRYLKVSGIIYCLSRKECDTVAQALCAAGLTAAPYHAGLVDDRRVRVQEDWLNDKFLVICATIAFGMGIDKPNVRYVIHYSLPKSIEGYYQESGRAGRDGEIALCILYYSYSDFQRLRHMIEKGSEDFASRKTHVDNLYKIVSYCENQTDCRRSQQLGYFGEVFKSDRCRENPKTACDNCSSKGTFKDINVTAEAQAIVQAVVRLVGRDTRRNQNITLILLADLFKGSKNQRMVTLNLEKDPLHGKGSAFKRGDAERLMHKLVLEGYLLEDIFITAEEHAVTYIRPGRKEKVDQLLGGRTEVRLALPSGSKQVAEGQSPSCNSENSVVRELETRCYDELLKECKNLGSEHHINYTNVMNLNALKQMSRDLPMTETEMLKIPHVTKVNFDKYGRRLLDITERFAAEKVVVLSEIEEMNVESQIEDDWEPQAESPYFESEGPRNKRKGAWGARKGYKRKKPDYPTKNKYKPQGTTTAKRTTAGATKRGGTKQNNSTKWANKTGATNASGKFSSKANAASTSTKFVNKFATPNPSGKFVNRAGVTPGILPPPKSMPKAPGRSFLPAPMVYQKS